MKRAIALLLTSILTVTLMGCGETNQTSAKDDGIVDIVCTTYPQYDWARQIVGENNENVKISLVVDNGMDVHNYQPSAEDMIEIANCDLVIYNGGTSEEWVEESVENNGQVKSIEIMKLLEEQMVEEEIVEGMAEGHHHDNEADEHEEVEKHHEEDGHTAGEVEYDEHVWLSLKNAMIVADEIKNAIIELDKENSALYEQNATKYIEELQNLDKKYEETVNASEKNILLFGDRFPFRYLVKDYGLTYYAAFPGCSAETEASFETIVFLAEKVKENHLPVILTIDGSDKSIAESIKSNVGNEEIEILTLNSLQSVSAENLENTTYISVMEENLEVLKQAL